VNGQLITVITLQELLELRGELRIDVIISVRGELGLIVEIYRLICERVVLMVVVREYIAHTGLIDGLKHVELLLLACDILCHFEFEHVDDAVLLCHVHRRAPLCVCVGDGELLHVHTDVDCALLICDVHVHLTLLVTSVGLTVCCT
jgi:hypothetical protein